MKILILGFTKIKYLPYLHLYLENLDLEKNDVHVVLWDRDGEEDEAVSAPVRFHTYRCLLKNGITKRKKIAAFLGYRKFVKRLLREESFDFIIPMHTFPGFLLVDVLKRKFKGKYIYDYRDKTFEHIGIFRRVIHKVIKHSYATFVSSDGFRAFLPKQDNIYTVHNFLAASLDHRPEAPAKKSDEPIALSYWGMIRPENLNRKMIEIFANDSRFTLHYYGTESALARRLKAHAEELGAQNVFFHGTYVSTDRYGFAESTHILHNLYENNTVQCAMGNKYYDGLMFYIPQICARGSFMGEMVERAGVGLVCSPDDEDFADKLYEYYKNLDFGAFKANCDKELSRIVEEQARTANILKQLK